MRFRLLSALLLVSLLAGCPLRNDPKKKTKGRNPADQTKDVSGDVAFQSFVGRLRTAVARKDAQMLASMMSSDFGYRWDAAPAGEDPFIYWDRNRLWPEFSRLVNDRWVPYEGYMVVPPQLAEDPEYAGFRAGVRVVNGAWRLAYFVPAPPAEALPPTPAPPAFQTAAP
jgi:hypothetical protein